MRRSTLNLILILILISIGGWVAGSSAQANGPGDDLFRLVPIDSGVTLAIEDLRGHSRAVFDSPLYEGLKALPSVRSWMNSERSRTLDRGFREVRSVLGLSVEGLRDDLLGDAVILALQPGPAGRPDQARGLLLVRPRNPALIPPLLKTLNEVQTKAGELVAVEDRSKGPVGYKVRRFKATSRPSEYYVLLDDGSFAWSNSELMIQSVLDRKATPGNGLGDDLTFQKVRRGLPDRPWISLFVNPRLLERGLLEASGPNKSLPDQPAVMLAGYLGSLRQLGFSIEWRDGLRIHSHEILAPEKLEPWLKRWLSRPASAVTMPAMLPPSAVAVVSSNIDTQAIREVVSELISEEDRSSLDNLKLALQGFLMGLDPLADVVPRLGPGVLLYVDIEPNRAVPNRFPIVGVLSWSNPPGVLSLAKPFDNAIRTAFALYALDPARRAAPTRVETRQVGDARLTVLTAGVQTLLSYRVDQNRVILSNSAEAVARFATGQAPAIFAAIRAREFPDAETFAMVDLQRLVEQVRSLRGSLASELASRSGRPVASADQDLGQLITLADLFQAVTFSMTSTPDGSEIHRSIHILAR